MNAAFYTPLSWTVERRGFMQWWLVGEANRRYNFELGPFRSRRGALKAIWW